MWFSPVSAVVAGEPRVVEKVWRCFFADPSQWWDHRGEKRNARYPDFKHKVTQESLWLNGKSKPPWVDSALVTMAPGTLQSNVFTWNTRLTRFVKAKKYGKTMELFWQMEQKGMNPDKFTFVPVLRACAGLQALEEGRRIHAKIIQCGFESDIYVSSSLIGMYAKCRNLDDALVVFNKMPVRNVVSWNVLILGHVKCGQGHMALELFKQMQQEGVQPVNFTFVAVINACASVAALAKGQRIHEQIIQKGHESDIFVGSSLIDMYTKCGSLEDAKRVFNKIARRNVVCWNAMIQGYVKCGQGQKALELYRHMRRERIKPVPVTFVAVLNACASLTALEEGRRVHEQIIQSSCESDVFVASSLVDMYAKCNSLREAQKVFNKMPTCDVVTWSAMIHAYVKGGLPEKGLELFQQMQQQGIDPVPGTFVALLKACGSLEALDKGVSFHEQIVKSGFASDLFVSSSLIDMYAKCGSIGDARTVFNNMPRRDVVSWNTMIQGYVKCGEGQEAVELFRQMLAEGFEPDRVTFVGVLNACASVDALTEGSDIHQQIVQRGLESDLFVGSSLIDMYTKCGSIEDAWKVFDSMPSHNVVTWNTMILGYVKCGQGQKALELSQRMIFEGFLPNTVTFVGILNACASVGSLEGGKHVHEQIIERTCESDLLVCNSLIDMYGKCGSIEDACRVFSTMPIRDVVSWNTMLRGYAIHGHTKEALGHFELMCQEGVDIDRFTFLSLLSACNHTGLVDEALHYLGSMSSAYEMFPSVEHRACIVDLLGRSGRLHEAEDFINTMFLKRDVSVWMSVLGSCRAHGNLKMGENIANRILELDPGNSAGYVMLLNIYAAAGKWEKIAQVNQQRLERGVEKMSSKTWIEVNCVMHSFTTDYKEHPHITDIYAELKRLSAQMEEAGYVMDTKLVFHDVEEEYEAPHLCHHTEKLAIGFGLTSTPPGTPLRIFKNVRVCRDCHTATKFISKITQRKIIVKDANRFHHFEDGLCSCLDYW